MTLRDRIIAMMERFTREDVNLHGFVLSVNGQEKAKAYYAPFREGQPHRMYSVSKTMTAMAVGMLADQGKVCLDDRITDYFQDWLPEHPSPWLTELRIRDMLRMATCYRWTTYREGIDENWARTFFEGTPDHAPGTVFYYDTGCSQVLAALVRRLSGQEVMDFLNERLFTPLGCRDERYWLRDPSGCCQGGTGLCMSLRDLHRVGGCLLEGGQGLVPGWFVEEMSKKQIGTQLQPNEEERYGYGWQCWQTRAGWVMYGMGGQLCVIHPEKKTVFSTIADTRLDSMGVQRIYNAFYEEVYPWIGREEMEPETFQAAVSPLENRSECAVSEAGPFRFPEGNQLGLKWLKLEQNLLRYENARGEVSLPFEPGRVLETSWPGWPEVPALSIAGWAEPGLLRVRCFAVGDAPCGFDLLLRLTPDGATVQSIKSYDPVTEGYEGVASGC